MEARTRTTTTTTTTTTGSKNWKPKGPHRPAAEIYCQCSKCVTQTNTTVNSKGYHRFSETHSDLFRVVRDFVHKFKPGQQITMSNYTSLNTKLSHAESSRPNKRALLCGVTYNHKRKYLLKGTVNDVMEMRNLLIEQYAYPAHCIRVLTGMFMSTLI